jgi:CDP-diacylglycerol--glycerol-3-phosphate 3-phosphatidyltransferase
MLRISLLERLKPNQTSAAIDAADSSVVAGKLKGSKFLSAAAKEVWVLEIMRPVEDFFIRARIHPNTISILGFFLTLIASVMLATNHLIWGGWLIVLSGCFDFLDGRVARRMNLTSSAGAFFDSVLDRYMDFAGLIALGILFRDQPWILCLVYLAILGSTATPYIRAKSEVLGIEGTGGEMQRPERVVLIGATAALSGYFQTLTYPFVSIGGELPPYLLIIGLALVALNSNKTALQRFLFTFRELKNRDRSAS